MIDNPEIIFRNSLDEFIVRFPPIHDNYKNLYEKPFQLMKQALEGLRLGKKEKTPKNQYDKNCELESAINNFYGAILGVVMTMNADLKPILEKEQESKPNHKIHPALTPTNLKVPEKFDNLLQDKKKQERLLPNLPN